MLKMLVCEDHVASSPCVLVFCGEAMSRILYWLLMAGVTFALMNNSCDLAEHGSQVLELRGESVTGVIEPYDAIASLTTRPCRLSKRGKVVAYQAEERCGASSSRGAPCRESVPFRLRLERGDLISVGQGIEAIITPGQGEGDCRAKVLRQGQRISLTSRGGAVGDRDLAFTGTPQEAEAVVWESSQRARLLGWLSIVAWVLVFWVGLWHDPHATATIWAMSFSPYMPPVLHSTAHTSDVWLYGVRRGGFSDRFVMSGRRVIGRFLMLLLGSGALLWFLALASFNEAAFVALMGPSWWPPGATSTFALHAAAVVWLAVVAVGVAGIWVGLDRAAPVPTARAERALRLLAPHLAAVALSKTPIHTTLVGWGRLGEVSWSCEVPLHGGHLTMALTTACRSHRASLWRRAEDAPEPCGLRWVCDMSSKQQVMSTLWSSSNIAEGLSPEGGDVGQWVREVLTARGVACRDLASLGGVEQGEALVWGAEDAEEASPPSATASRRVVPLRSAYEAALKALEGDARAPAMVAWYWLGAALVCYGVVSLIARFYGTWELAVLFPVLVVMGSFWASAIYLPRVLSSPEPPQEVSPPLWVDGGGMQIGDARVTWAESPEQVQWRLSRGRADEQGRAWLNVEVRQRGERDALCWRTPVVVEGAESLPVLDERAPMMSARDFHDHVWPVLRWLSALKGEPLPPVRLTSSDSASKTL